MRVVSLDEILDAFDPDDAYVAIEEGFRRYAAGEVQVGAVGHLAFTGSPGDCHIKAAHAAGDDVFVVKVATGFYRNPEIGLSPTNGFMAVISAVTGEVVALLHDRGVLTDIRTAMAGAVAARAIAPARTRTLGVVGAGMQAGLQARHVARAFPDLETVLIWGRRADAAEALAETLRAEGLPAESVADVADLAARSDLIVTATPSTSPILTDAMVRPGARIVAVGADAPGKQELDAGILARARRVVVDAVSQCVDHGEAGWAVRQGLVREADLLALGALLADPALGGFAAEDIVVADLTGVAVQDLAIAKSVWGRLAEV